MQAGSGRDRGRGADLRRFTPVTLVHVGVHQVEQEAQGLQALRRMLSCSLYGTLSGALLAHGAMEPRMD